MLYTVNRYVQHQSTPELQQVAKERLAPLIRVPHLSNRWLMELLTARAPEHLVLHSVWELIRMFVNLREEQHAKRWHVSGVPHSWRWCPRTSDEAVGNVEVRAQFSVSVIKQASCRVFEQQLRVDSLLLEEPQMPLAGAEFRPQLVFRSSAAGMTLGFFVKQLPSSSEAGTQVFFHIGFSLDLGPVSRSGSALSCSSGVQGQEGSAPCSGWHGFLQIGPMAGGWDDVAWANKGLPTTGAVDIRMKFSLSALPANNQQA